MVQVKMKILIITIQIKLLKILLPFNLPRNRNFKGIGTSSNRKWRMLKSLAKILSKSGRFCKTVRKIRPLIEPLELFMEP